MITREFNLYLHAGHSIPLVINVNQYDHGEQWLFTLFNSNGTQYVPSSGAIVGIKSDNLGIINTGSVDAQGRVVINETQQMTAAVGKAVFELLIDDQTHGTANFIVLVEPKPGDQADLSESDLSLIQQAIDGTSATAIAQGVSDWMDENLTPTTPVVDTSLTVQGAAADSAKVGQEISDLKSQIETKGGLSNDAKIALVNGFAHVGWDDQHGKDYYDAIVDALDIQIPCTGIALSESSISSLSEGSATTITASVTPSNTTDAVIWSSSNESVATVSAGVITGVSEGICTITATCGNQTATCSVTVIFSGTSYSVTNTLSNCSTSNSSTSVHENATYTATITVDEGYELLNGSVTVMLGNNDVTLTAFNYSTKEITIVATGDIAITANATEQLLPTWTSGTPLIIDGSEVVVDTTLNANTGAEETKSGVNATGYLNCVGAFAVTNSVSSGRLYFYDRNKKYISSVYDNVSYSVAKVPDGASYVRSAGNATQVSQDGTSTLTLIPMKKPTELFTEGVQELTWEPGGGTGKRVQTNYTPIYGAKKIDANTTCTVKLYDADKNFIRQATTVNLNNLTRASFFLYAYIQLYGLYAATAESLVETLYASAE